MPSRIMTTAKAKEHVARWYLLRVCRQVYVETAMIAPTSITFCFATITDLPRYLRSTRLQHVRAIHFAADSTEMKIAGNNPCVRFLSCKGLKSLRKLKITLSLFSMNTADEAAELARVKEMVKEHFPGKEIEVSKGTYSEHFAYWKES
jgi:hypothetical protein